MSARWLVIGLVAVLGAAGPAAAQDKPYVWKEGKVEIQFPGAPQETKGKLELLKDDGKVKYIVMLNVIPDLLKTPKEMYPFIFNLTRDNLAKSLNGKVVGDKEVKTGDHTGKEIQVQLPSGDIYRVRLFITGDRLYQVIVLAPKDVASGKDAETFFKSFKIQS